ncbi:oxidoreductase [Catellatospora sp. IY07-71]|uniref:aldo/keto reductase n=1 Tax=Catellatospora sp. IY07-71 TaxID=2728827 RepID=UPI001BB3004E|nr:aldo/keto reductase [Catellatospora sp. IY07-71]BCJ74322.1 oxidoreductase [Catellatospora sp. IY07-71]
MALDRLDLTSPTARLGLGLAAVGRPGYLNLGRDRDLPSERTVEAMRARSHELLDAAYAAGMRYVDTARSYGRAEEFLASWLAGREVPDVVVGSKWGYTYTAGWRVDAPVHEVKDHSLGVYERQLGETRELLGDRLDLYQIHSLTIDSPALRDTALHRRLAELAASGVTVGFSSSGPRQAETIEAALGVEVDGRLLFRSVQATWNLLEPSAGPALAAARAAGCQVIIKEALANGRLAASASSASPAEAGPGFGALLEVAAETGATPDAVAVAAVLRQPWVGVVLSGAATTPQLGTNLNGTRLELSPGQLDRLAALAEPAEAYWQQRAALPWT